MSLCSHLGIETFKENANVEEKIFIQDAYVTRRQKMERNVREKRSTKFCRKTYFGVIRVKNVTSAQFCVVTFLPRK